MNRIALTAVIGTLSLGLAACDVEQTEEAELPDVDVSVEGGNLPEYDVDTADVEIGSEEVTVDVPTVDVEMPDAGEPGDD